MAVIVAVLGSRCVRGGFYFLDNPENRQQQDARNDGTRRDAQNPTRRDGNAPQDSKITDAKITDAKQNLDQQVKLDAAPQILFSDDFPTAFNWTLNGVGAWQYDNANTIVNETQCTTVPSIAVPPGNFDWQNITVRVKVRGDATCGGSSSLAAIVARANPLTNNCTTSKYAFCGADLLAKLVSVGSVNLSCSPTDLVTVSVPTLALNTWYDVKFSLNGSVAVCTISGGNLAQPISATTAITNAVASGQAGITASFSQASFDTFVVEQN